MLEGKNRLDLYPPRQCLYANPAELVGSPLRLPRRSAPGLGEDVRLHLTKEEIGEGRGGGFVGKYDEQGCLDG